MKQLTRLELISRLLQVNDYSKSCVMEPSGFAVCGQRYVNERLIINAVTGISSPYTVKELVNNIMNTYLSDIEKNYHSREALVFADAMGIDKIEFKGLAVIDAIECDDKVVIVVSENVR